METHVDTRPISAVLAISSYQLPVARDYSAGFDAPSYSPGQQQDTVEISRAAREKAAQNADQKALWGEVRYDAPHTDDPDMPWEAAHQEWVDLMQKVFPGERPADGASSEGDGAAKPD